MKFRLFISSILVMLFADRMEIWNAGSLPRGWTVDMLLKPHTSLPPNELIAGPMYLKGYIERLGTGTEDVAKLCAKSGLPAPGFTEGVDFRAVLKRSKIEKGRDCAITEATTEVTSDGGTLKAPSNASCGDTNLPVNLPVNLPEGLTETAKKIFLLLSGNGKFTYDRLASAVGVTRETVRVSIKSLVDAGAIRRVGPDKGGHWEVVK